MVTIIQYYECDCKINMFINLTQWKEKIKKDYNITLPKISATYFFSFIFHIHTHIFTYMHTHIHTNLYAHIQTQITRSYIYTYIPIYTRIYLYICVHMQTEIYTHIHHIHFYAHITLTLSFSAPVLLAQNSWKGCGQINHIAQLSAPFTPYGQVSP